MGRTGPNKRCPFCRYETYFFTDEEPIAMRRLYIREAGKWVPVGWICRNCGYTEFDGPWKKEYRTARTERPKEGMEKQLLDVLMTLFTKAFKDPEIAALLFEKFGDDVEKILKLTEGEGE